MAADEIETVDAELLAPEPAPAPLVTQSTAVQAAAVAATSFAAGAVTIAVVRRRRVRRAAKRRGSALGKVVASRSFLVDVHVLGDR